MEIRNLSNDVLLITIRKGQHSCNELTSANQIIAEQGNYDVIVDFSGLEIVTSLIIGRLIELRNLLRQRGHRLILCNVHFLSKCVFRVVGLRSVFEFAEDKSAALAALEGKYEQLITEQEKASRSQAKACS